MFGIPPLESAIGWLSGDNRTSIFSRIVRFVGAELPRVTMSANSCGATGPQLRQRWASLLGGEDNGEDTMKSGTLKTALVIGVGMLLAACGGGGSSSGGGGTTPQATLTSGTFVDS